MSNTSYKSDLVMGRKYRDSHTNLTGILTAVYFYEHGCERGNIEVLGNDGKLDSYVFDAPRLIDVETELRAATDKTGGPGLGNEARNDNRARR